MNSEKKRFTHSLIFPTFLLIIMWIVKLYEYLADTSFSHLGIYPLKLKGLIGIIFSPFLHGDFKHLLSNTFPFFFLSIGLFFFYRKSAYKIFFSIYLLTGIWVWLIGRQSYHIGVSGVIYGIALFIMISGLIHARKSLIAVSFIVIFLYGSMIWGVLPTDEHISWESHLMGAVSGILTAIWFSKETPDFEEKIIPKKEYQEYEDINISDSSYSNIEYFYEEED